MSNENYLEEKPLYLKGIDDLAKDIFPMEKIIQWFTDYYGNEDVVRDRLKNPPILAPLDVKKFILAQALYKRKLSSVKNLDEFLNNERTEDSHFENNERFNKELEEALDLYLQYLNPLQSDLKTKKRILFNKSIVTALGFDYEELEKSLESGIKSPEMKKFLSFLKGAKAEEYDTIGENYADYFIKYYNHTVSEKKNITFLRFDPHKIKTPEQFEEFLNSTKFLDIDYVDTCMLSAEQKEILADIITDDRKFYNWSEEKVVATVNRAFNTSHKTIDDILIDFDTEFLACLHDRLFHYKNKHVDFYRIDENLTKEQKDDLAEILNANGQFHDVDDEYGDFVIDVINDIFKTSYTTMQEVYSDPKLSMLFSTATSFVDRINKKVEHLQNLEKISSNDQYLQQSEQGKSRLEATQKAINLLARDDLNYAYYEHKHACTMYRLEPFQISLGIIIHEFNHQMLHGSSYEENQKKFQTIGKSLHNKGIGSPTAETINEFLSVRMMQNISIEDLKNYPFPIAEIKGCGYTPAVEYFWNQLIKLEDTLKECQLAGTYLPLEQRLGAEKLRAFDFAVRKFYRENISSISKSQDEHFEEEFEEELNLNPTTLKMI